MGNTKQDPVNEEAEVLTQEKVTRLCQTADNVSPRCGLFFHLLFTTGVRIGAVRHLTWSQLGGTSAGGVVPESTVVREKGGFPRILLLNHDVRERIRMARPTNPLHSNSVYVFGSFSPGHCFQTTGGHGRGALRVEAGKRHSLFNIFEIGGDQGVF